MRSIVVLVALLAAQVLAAEPDRKSPDVGRAIEQGLTFLAKDAVKWRDVHKCVSCHHAALVVWSMREAKQRGSAVDEPLLAELTTWLASSGDGKTGLPRPPGRPKAFNSKPIYFTLGLAADPAPSEQSRAAMRRLVGTVNGDQVEDGSWVIWPDTRRPIFGDSVETITVLATLAVLPVASSGDASARAVRDKAVAWLAKTKTDDDPQSVALRLVLWQRLGRPAGEINALVERIKSRQNADGGWSQAKGMASDAWATGQALYALASAGSKPDDPCIARGRAFLVKTQRADGSWPMTSRPIKPGGKGSTSLVPITGAGSAWGVLGLVRSR